MPIAYWDYANGNDTTGDGSAGNPYKTLNKASTAAGVGGEVRCAGRPLIDLGTATWTQNSTTVTFSSPPGLLLGDLIRPSPEAVPNCPAYRVQSCLGTTVTLLYPYRGSSTTCTTHKIPTYTLTSGQTTANQQQLYTFGWRLSDETQPSDYVSAFIPSSFSESYMFSTTHSGTWKCDGRLFVHVYSMGKNAFNLGTVSAASSCRFVGNLDISGSATTNGGFYVGGAPNAPVWKVYADCILSSYSDTLVNAVRSSLVCEKIVAHNVTYGTYSGAVSLTDGQAYIGELEVRSAKISINNMGGIVYAGHARIADGGLYIHFGGGHSGRTVVGYMDTSDTLTWSDRISLVIGGPISRWRFQDGALGVADKVSGRGGSGYGLRIDPTSPRVPFSLPLVFTVGQGCSVTVSCYAYYSGSQGAPVVWWELCDGQGCTVDQKPITLPNGTGWSNAQKLSVTFTGTTAQAGVMIAWLHVCDNSGGDAVCYFDDFELSIGAGDQNTMGLEVHGTELILQQAQAAGGSGIAFPIGL